MLLPASGKSRLCCLIGDQRGSGEQIVYATGVEKSILRPKQNLLVPLVCDLLLVRQTCILLHYFCDVHFNYSLLPER